MNEYLEDKLDKVMEIRKRLEYQKKSFILLYDFYEQQYKTLSMILDELEGIYKILLEKN
jgi:hypothetical protein